MKKNKATAILCCTIVLVLFAVVVIIALTSKGSVDKEYRYNTSVVENTNAPVAGDADIEAIDSFKQDKDCPFLDMPYDIKEIPLEIVAIGGYTGDFDNGEGVTKADDIFSIVVKNYSDKVVSYSNFIVEYADKKTCSFSPTNIPPKQSAVIFESTGQVKYSDVSSFKISDPMAVYSNELPIIKEVGVSYDNGEFVVTNLTNENLGDVYIRYKNISDGNAYLGGTTYSALVQNVEPYQTYRVPADNYDEKNSVIIVVENIKD